MVKVVHAQIGVFLIVQHLREGQSAAHPPGPPRGTGGSVPLGMVLPMLLPVLFLFLGATLMHGQDRRRQGSIGQDDLRHEGLRRATPYARGICNQRRISEKRRSRPLSPHPMGRGRDSTPLRAPIATGLKTVDARPLDRPTPAVTSPP